MQTTDSEQVAPRRRGRVRPFPSDDAVARRLQGFGPVGLLALLLIALVGTVTVGGVVAVPVSGFLVLGWAKLSYTPWRELGYVRPASWARTIAVGIVLGVALKLALKAVVMPLLGADPVNHAFHFIAGDPTMLAAIIWASLAAGFGEETVNRGYLFERGRRLLGSGPLALTAIVLATSLLFGLAHYPVQGLAGAEQGLITGLVFGTIYALSGRIWTIMIAHAAFDITAAVLIYLDLESAVAHLIWR